MPPKFETRLALVVIFVLAPVCHRGDGRDRPVELTFLRFRRGDALPAELLGIPLTSWAPPARAGWTTVDGQMPDLAEPPFKPARGKNGAAGVVIVEADHSIWLVEPTNHFGGYSHTFPKGRTNKDLSMQAAAIKEAFEETGLKVAITGFLGDFQRSTTTTRYYLARRVAGCPIYFGWETQAVHLVPLADLPALASNANDQPIVQAILAHLSSPKD